MTLDEALSVFARAGLRGKVGYFDEATAQALADLFAELDAARVREAGLKLAADQYSESRDQWMLKAKAAIERGAADHAVAAAARAWRTARETLNGIADAETALLAAVAATDESLKAERGNA